MWDPHHFWFGRPLIVRWSSPVDMAGCVWRCKWHLWATPSEMWRWRWKMGVHMSAFHDMLLSISVPSTHVLSALSIWYEILSIKCIYSEMNFVVCFQFGFESGYCLRLHSSWILCTTMTSSLLWMCLICLAGIADLKVMIDHAIIPCITSKANRSETSYIRNFTCDYSVTRIHRVLIPILHWPLVSNKNYHRNPNT